MTHLAEPSREGSRSHAFPPLPPLSFAARPFLALRPARGGRYDWQGTALVLILWLIAVFLLAAEVLSLAPPPPLHATDVVDNQVHQISDL